MPKAIKRTTQAKDQQCCVRYDRAELVTQKKKYWWLLFTRRGHRRENYNSKSTTSNYPEIIQLKVLEYGL